MAALGLRHAECDGLRFSDLRAPLGAFWEMRRLHGEDPEAARWWEGSGEWVESRSRSFMRREALGR